MKTESYRLKSKPELTVEVPADYAPRAGALLDTVLNRPWCLADEIDRHPFLTNPGILNKVGSLLRTEKENPIVATLQDEIYLRICIYGNEPNLSGEEKEQAWNLDQGMIRAVKEL